MVFAFVQCKSTTAPQASVPTATIQTQQPKTNGASTISTTAPTAEQTYINQYQLPFLVLKVNGKVSFQRHDENDIQYLWAGTVLSANDLIYINSDASLDILCEGPTFYTLNSVELAPIDTLKCPIATGEGILFGEPGRRHTIIQRGSKQNYIPYSIYPRATVVRHDLEYVEWHLTPEGIGYSVTLLGGSEPIDLITRTFRSEVDQGKDVARMYFTPTVTLTASVEYTLKICVEANSKANSGCTSDRKWAGSTIDSSFYYETMEPQTMMINGIVEKIGGDSPESLFAQAYILSRPSVTIPNRSDKLGAYGEAIQLMEKLIQQYSNSDLAQSPIVYYELGKLYELVGLPINAITNYQHSIDLSSKDQHSEISKDASDALIRLK
jgi:hypothetical protein